jgi:hypothetical protein
MQSQWVDFVSVGGAGGVDGFRCTRREADRATEGRFMSARIQTLLPFRIQICLNGRKWLAPSMDAAGLHYVQPTTASPGWSIPSGHSAS